MTKFYATVSADGLTLWSKETDKVIDVLPIIQADERHRSYILSTWVRSYESTVRRLSVFGMRIRGEDYRAGETRVAEANWANSKVVTNSEGFTVHAWVCGTPGRLWHAYVTPELRRSGVASSLVGHVSGWTYSCHKPWPHQRVPRGHSVNYDPWGCHIQQACVQG